MDTDIVKSKVIGRPKSFCREEAIGKAMGVFCENGYEATSVAQLGQVMNMKPPSLYNAFGDKETLFLEVLDYYHKPYAEAANQIFKNSTSAQSAIEGLMDLAKSFHCAPDAKGCLIVNSAINVGSTSHLIAQKIKSMHDKNEAMICGRLKQGQNEGDLRKDINVTSIARYINGVLQGAAVIARSQQSPQTVEDILDQGYKGFLGLIN